MKQTLLAVFVVLAFIVAVSCQKAEEKAPPPSTPAVTPAPAPTASPTLPQEAKPAETSKPEASAPKAIKEKAAIKEKKAQAPTISEQKIARVAPPPPPETRVLPKAPSFILSDIHGNRIGLNHFKGRVVALEFSATWCPPCMKSAQNLRGLYDRYHDRGFEIVMIFLAEQPNTADMANNIVKKYGLPYTILLDNKQGVFKQYGVTAMPTFITINREGRIVGKKMGTRAEEELAKDVEKLF